MNAPLDFTQIDISEVTDQGYPLVVAIPTPLVNGPALWQAILDALPVRSAVIAGGAVRDYLLGVVPKDLDIFLPSEDYGIPFGFDSLGDDRREEYAALPIIDVVTRGVIAGHQIDLIGIHGMTDGHQLMETFDFGVTRCWFQDGVIHDTLEAIQDRDRRTVTMLLDDRTERSVQRFERFNERMGGGWVLVRPSA